jgi:hypothetical protein
MLVEPFRPRKRSNMSHPFRLIDEGGKDLGPFSTSAPNWSPGHRIQVDADYALEVVRVVPAAEGDDVNGYLVVRQG